MYRWTESGDRHTVYGRTPDECLAARFAPAVEVVVDDRTTLAEYLEVWLGGLTLRSNTIANHRYNVERWLVPLFGTRVRLSQVERELVRVKLVELRATRTRLGTLPAPNTVRHALATLSAAMSSAVEDGRIASNPCRGLEANTAEDAQSRIGIEHELPTELELRRVIRAAAGDDRVRLLQVAAATGLRQSELLGLAIEDVDLVGRYLHVRQSLRRSDRKVGRVKNRASDRYVPIPRALVPVLEAQLLEVERLELVAGSTWSNPSGLLFTGPKGQPVVGSTVTHWLEDLARAELGRSYRWHDLRHFYASNLLASGVGIELVAKWLGHSSTGITFATYYHVIRDDRNQDRAELAGGVLAM
jgi:integrase